MTPRAANLRTLLPIKPRIEGAPAPTYADVCREERNFAALLYADLLRPAGLERFLSHVPGLEAIDEPTHAEVFFEYAHARDWWHGYGKQFGSKRTRVGERSEAYRAAICQLIGAPEGCSQTMSETLDFNQFFIGEGNTRASAYAIQMPNQWNQQLFHDWVAKSRDRGWYTSEEDAREFAKRICRLKWAFNAKADLVIHLPDQRAVCVEIKVGSDESGYSAGGAKERSTPAYALTQMQVQRYVMEDLLGYQTHFVFLTPDGRAVKSGKRAEASEQRPADSPLQRSSYLSWHAVLGHWDTSVAPAEQLPFVSRMLASHALQPSKRRTAG